MASYVNITLDTTGPGGVTVSINGGDLYTADQDVTLTIGTSDGDTTGYQMKVYGDVDTTNDANVQATEGASAWISYATSKAIKLSTGDALKTIRVKVRDDVNNPSSEATDTITLDTTVPVVAVQSGPTPAKISKQTGKRTSTVVWQSDTAYDEYQVRVVPSSGSAHTAGTLIGTANGSSNVSGSAGGYPATTNVTTDIDGADLEAAGAEGANVVKVFVMDSAGNWSA